MEGADSAEDAVDATTKMSDSPTTTNSGASPSSPLGDAPSTIPDQTETFILNNLKVSVPETERRHGPDGDFVAFKVEAAIRSGVEDAAAEAGIIGSLNSGPWSVWRRFNNFELLRQYLCSKYPSAIVPPIPEKTLNFKISKLGADKFDPQFIEKRRTGFERFLRRVLAHPTLGKAPIVLRFMQNQNWRQFLTVTENGKEKKWSGQTNFDSALQKFSGSPKEPNKIFRDEKSYNSNLRDDIANILAIHIRVATNIHILHSDLNDYGEGLSNLVELGSGRTVPMLDDMAQQFDSMTGTGPELLKREEICFADRLKEYARFADAATELLENQERVQIKFEKARAAVEAKQKSIAGWKKPEGFSGFFKGLASKDTAANKIAQEEAELEVLIDDAATAETERDVFDQLVSAELERYKESRNRGLKAILLEYAKIQRQYCQKNLAYWIDVKGACDDEADEVP